MDVEGDLDTAFCNVCSSAIPNSIACDDFGTESHECMKPYFIDGHGECTLEPCREFDEYGLCIECNTRLGVTFRTQADTCVIECDEGYEELGDYACELQCPDGWYRGVDECLRCNVEGCKTCSKDGVCTECFDDVDKCDLTCEYERLFVIHDYFY